MEAYQLPEIDVVDEPMMKLGDIPIVEEKPKVKKEDLFYAVATESHDPINDWKKANEELIRTGESTLFNLAQDKWKKEQDNVAKATITGLMMDDTVPEWQKKAAISTYLSGGFVQKDLRDKYLVQQATVDNSILEMDRRAQDIIADRVVQQDQQKQVVENIKRIEDAEITLSGALKGTGAVASQLVLSIPAGYMAIFSLLKEQNPDKAAEIIKKVQEEGYNPTDASSQKVIGYIQQAMDFIDIPFKWAGDQTLDITGSPGAATAVYAGGSMLGYYGTYKVAQAGVKGVVKGVRKLSPADTTAAANKTNAANLGASAVADNTGELAAALGTTKEALVADWTLAKITQDLADRPDLTNKIIELDKKMSGLFEETRVDPNIYPVTQIAEEKAKYVAIMTEASGPKLLQSQSALDFEFADTGSYLKGKSLYGRNETNGYETQMGAEYALEQMKQTTASLPDPGKLDIIERDGQYFLQWEFTRKYDPLDHLTFGEDALQAHLISPKADITKAANSIVGEWIWPAFMRMKSWIPSIGAMGGWKQARIEQAYLSAQRELVYTTPHKAELSKLIRDGEREGKLYTLAEVRAKHPDLSTKEAQNLYAGYYGFRRIEDYLYNVSDRKFRYNLNKEGYQTLYSPTGERIGFASSQIPLDVPVKKIWDFELKQAVDRTPEMAVIKLHDAVKSTTGDALYNYATLGRHKLGPVQPGALTKVPGYVSRQYKEWFVLEKQPKKLEVDGNKITDAELRNYRTAVAMGATKKEIEKLRADFQDNHPEQDYFWRAERKDIEDKVMFDSKVYDSFFKEHQKRGDALRGLNREAELEDVLISQTKSIMAMSRMEAFGPYMEHARKEFVKSYGEFTGHKFPDQINGIQPLSRMTPDEAKKFQAAQKVYQQLELQQFSTLPSDELWKGAFNSVADVFEKIGMSKASPATRALAAKGVVPVRLIKALGSHMWLYMRPQRMLLIQPQQLLELASINPTYTKVALEQAGAIFPGMLARAKTLERLKPAFDAMGRQVTSEYDAIVAALEKTGVMQAVDTNQMVHGLWRDSLEELAPGKFAYATRTVKKGVLLPTKIGRSIGYDPSELLNQIGIWLFSKQRWQEANPGKDWNTPENIATIGQLTWRMGHGASTRAGMMPMQEGLISTLAQFIAIPHKGFMQMISSPDLTAADKAKLFGARMFWYGKWGVPGGAALYLWMEQNLPAETSEQWEDWSRGMYDAVMNKSMGYITGTETDSYWSKSFTTVPESIFVWDVVATLYDMATGEMDKAPKFPFMNATTSLFKTVRKAWDMYNIPTLTGEEADWGKIAWQAANVYGGTMSDIDKALVVDHLTKTGQKMGQVETTGEIIAKLFGPKTRYESVVYDMLKVKGKREKYIANKSKEIHERLMALRASGVVETEKYWTGVKAFLSSVDEEYKEDIVRGIKKWDRSSQETVGDSLTLYWFNNYREENDGKMDAMRNTLSNLDDPRMNNIKEVLK